MRPENSSSLSVVRQYKIPLGNSLYDFIEICGKIVVDAKWVFCYCGSLEKEASSLKPINDYQVCPKVGIEPAGSFKPPNQ